MFNRPSRSRIPRTRNEQFLAPTAGWVQSGNIVRAGRDQAEVLDNIIPTSQGARLRGGSAFYANCGASIVRLLPYASGAARNLFAASASAIFDADAIAGGQANTFGAVEGLGSGDWSATQMSTAGGEFIVMVNGTDYALYYDGSNWNPIADVAISNVGFDAQTGVFAVGETLTGGTSGATATIYGVTKTSATAGVLKVGTITGGPYQDNEALTDGGTGAATADGASASASSITITGIATTSLAQVWSFKERLFFVEKASQSAWYLPVESIGGAASEINLGSVFTLGGNLLFGATWSLDSGSGIDDVCIFVSDQGEIAVYEGTDPASASTWSLVGVYKIGAPLNKHAFFQAGGDLALLTEDGIVPVSEALRKDRAALQASAITYPIEEAWKNAIAQRTVDYPISATLWQSQTLLLVGTPARATGKNVSFAANARTGAWCRVTGWDVRCSAVSNDVLYFADNAGVVYKADSGGTDNGIAYTGAYVPKFAPGGELRSAQATQITYRARERLTFDMYAHADYQVDDMPAPTTATAQTADVWGTGVWGEFVWGGAEPSFTYVEWQATYANGYSLSPGLVITSNQTGRIDFEILSMQLRYELGHAL